MIDERHSAEGHGLPMYKILPDPLGDDVPNEIVVSSLQEVASVMSQLTDQLTKATEAFWCTRTLRSAEAQANDLLIRSQAAADELINSLEEKGRQIVIDGRGEASKLVDEAHTRAAAIIEGAERNSFLGPEGVTQLSAAIEGVRSMSDVLAQDLALLSESLAQAAQPAPIPNPPPVPVMSREPADPHALAVEPAPELLPTMTTQEPDAPEFTTPVVDPHLAVQGVWRGA